MRKLVLVSGGFDPIHSGHIYLIQEASKYGEIVVLLNSDEWLRKKKGKEFMSFNERAIIMKSLKNAINKYPSHKIRFANGGDRNGVTTPEKKFCDENNIETLWGIGGKNKSNSSSWILKRWQEKTS